MYIKIHRGTKQIGGNIIEIGSQHTKIIFDCGEKLPDIGQRHAKDTIQIPGLTVGQPAYDALFISHYHNDHCGLLNRVLTGIPVYAGSVTKRVLEVISDFAGTARPAIEHSVEDGIPIRVNDITVTPIGVPHSAADAYMFLIQDDGKNILYTGDYKTPELIKQKMKDHLSTAGGLDALISEGTNISTSRNVLRGNIKSEQDVEKAASAIMKQYKGDIFILSSSTNIDRVQSLYNACQKTGRIMAQDLFMAGITNSMDASTPSPLHSPDVIGFIPNYVCKEKNPRIYSYLEKQYPLFVKAEDLAGVKNKVIFIRPTMLPFLNRLKRYSDLQDSALIYSVWDGYKQNRDIGALLSYCMKNGIPVETLHVSGHLYRQELEEFINTINPKTVIPIHCEEQERNEFLKLYSNCVMLNDVERYEV